MSADIQRTIDAVWRIESARIVATLTKVTGDIGLAEDLAQEALVEALEQWPDAGVPRNPGAWLTLVAKRRAIDGWRRSARSTRGSASSPPNSRSISLRITPNPSPLMTTSCG